MFLLCIFCSDLNTEKNKSIFIYAINKIQSYSHIKLTNFKNYFIQTWKVSFNNIFIYYISSIQDATFTAFFRQREVLWVLPLDNRFLT